MHLSDKSLLPAGYFWHHPPKHVRKKGLLLSCDIDRDSEHQTKSTLYNDIIFSRYTKRIQTDMYTYHSTYQYIHDASTYLRIHTDTYRYRVLQALANHGREEVLRGCGGRSWAAGATPTRRIG
jgi:hypothetical protein